MEIPSALGHILATDVQSARRTASDVIELTAALLHWSNRTRTEEDVTKVAELIMTIMNYDDQPQSRHSFNVALCRKDLVPQRKFTDINISQGSAAIRLRCGGIFSDRLIANLRDSVPVKEF